MSEGIINSMMDTTLKKVREMVDVSTIIGDTIKLENGTCIIPVSKVSYGFVSGGSEFPNKKEGDNLFGGGSSAGVTLAPVAFLSVNANGDVKILHVEPTSGAVDRVIDMVPEVFDKVGSLMKKSDKSSKKDNTSNKSESKE